MSCILQRALRSLHRPFMYVECSGRLGETDSMSLGPGPAAKALVAGLQRPSGSNTSRGTAQLSSSSQPAMSAARQVASFAESPMASVCISVRAFQSRPTPRSAPSQKAAVAVCSPLAPTPFSRTAPPAACAGPRSFPSILTKAVSELRRTLGP